MIYSNRAIDEYEVRVKSIFEDIHESFIRK